MGDRDVPDGETTGDPAADSLALAARLAGEPALHGAVLGLTCLDVGALPTTEALRQVAQLAARAIPHADGAALCLLDAEPEETTSTAPFVHTVEDIAHRLHEGPYVTAVAEHCAVCSGSLGGEARWPHFGPQAGRLGVHSVLSLPLTVHGVVLGALDVYAHGRDAFDARCIELGELFALPAALTVSTVRRLELAERHATQLQQALTSRAVIDRAIGIVISRTGATGDEAFDRLRTMSQQQHCKVAVIAERLVEAAARRTRSRLAQVPAACDEDQPPPAD